MPAPSFIPAALPPFDALPVVAADGARFEVLLQRPAGETKRLLYWLPALGVAAKHYVPLAQALAEQGVAVAIHEWRGIGSSDRRASRHADWGYRQLLEDDLPAGIAAVRASLPPMRLYLGGHSLGGQIASLYASLHPQDVAGLLAVASGAPYWRQYPQGRLLWCAYALAPWLARLVGHLPGRRIGFGGNEARQLIDDWARTGRTGATPLRAWRRISKPRCIGSLCRCSAYVCRTTGLPRRRRCHGCSGKCRVACKPGGWSRPPISTVARPITLAG